MKLNNAVANILLSALLAIEAWTLREIVNLKVQVAELKVQVGTFEQTKIAKN